MLKGLGPMISNAQEIYAANIDTLANEGWKLKENQVFFEGTTAYQIFERSISWKCSQAFQGNWSNFSFSNQAEERKVEVKQNHLLKKLNADILQIIVKKLAPISIFHLSSVDKQLNEFLKKDAKHLNEIKLALFQACDFRNSASKQLAEGSLFDDSIQTYQKGEKLDEVSRRISNLFFRYNNHINDTKRLKIGNFLTINLNIGRSPYVTEKRKENEILENLHVHPHHAVKLYTDLSNLSRSSIINYLENSKIEDPVFKLKIKCFLENFEIDLDEIKSIFSIYLEGDDRYQVTELIKLLSIINYNAAEECFKKNIDFLLKTEDSYMLLDKELIKFFINEDPNVVVSGYHKYNLKDLNDKIYTTSATDATNEFFNYINENNFKSHEEFKVMLDSDDEFAKCWKSCLGYLTISILRSLFNEMVAVKTDIILNQFKEKMDLVGLNSDYFLFNMVKAANDFPTAMKIVNLIDDPEFKLRAFDLGLYDYSLLKPR